MPILYSPPPVIHERYRLTEWLGQGSMGMVYRARDEKLDRPVVIKFLLRDAGGGRGEARFLREARSVARLSHPNIMSIYDVGQQDEWDFLVLEYIPGSDLISVLRQHGYHIPPARTVEIARAVLSALAYAHQQGIIHRDLKPENIKVTPDGQVKVMDFSLALARGEERLTQEGAVIGTALYLAPECISGHGSTARSDLYALGAVLYEMLTGRPPFEGDTFTALVSSILHGALQPPTALAPEVSPALERVVLRLLARDFDLRYTSADEALADLNEAVLSPADEATGPGSQGVGSGASAVVEEERRRMAGMVQARVIEPLNLLLLQTSAFEQALSAQPTARAALSVVSALARQVLQQARDLESALHPAVLETLGLGPALEMLKGQVERSSGLQLDVEMEQMPARPTAALELCVYRQAEDVLEALIAQNVRQAGLRLGCVDDALRLEITWPVRSALPEKISGAFQQRAGIFGGRVEVAAGQLLAWLPMRGAAGLTARELDVLQGLVDGLSNKEIAARLSISPRTVNFHLDNIYAKLGVSTRTEAAVIAQRQGWARRPSDLLPR